VQGLRPRREMKWDKGFRNGLLWLLMRS